MSVDFRLRLLEKAVEMRDRGYVVRAQQLVDVANWLKRRIEAIAEQGPQQRDRLREASTGSASREDQNWTALESRRSPLSSMAGFGKSEPRPREAARRRRAGGLDSRPRRDARGWRDWRAPTLSLI